MLCIVRLPSLKEDIVAFIPVPFLGRWRGVLRDSVTLHSPHLANIIDLDLIWEALFYSPSLRLLTVLSIIEMVMSFWQRKCYLP